ncbi:conserved hypothetical protein [Burkholderia latens]
MTSSPLVPVEGALARPRAAPLDGVPPFGREWTFRGASGTRALATLTTSCIDVDAPHRSCRWQPQPVAPPSLAGAPAVAPDMRRRSIDAAAGRAPDRRALHAACWSIGAFVIIGWLVAAHEPFPVFALASMQAAGATPRHGNESKGTVRTVAALAAKPVDAPAQQVAAHPVATSAGPTRPARGATPKAAPQRSEMASHAAPVSIVSAAPPLSRQGPAGKRAKRARASDASASRLAPRPPVTQHASRAPSHDHRHRRSHALPPQPSLDDPLTLIAIAHALNASLPAPPDKTPGAAFDWTAQLSHRRVTDVYRALPR